MVTCEGIIDTGYGSRASGYCSGSQGHVVDGIGMVGRVQECVDEQALDLECRIVGVAVQRLVREGRAA